MDGPVGVLDLSQRLPTMSEIDSAKEAAAMLARASGAPNAPTTVEGRTMALAPALAELVIELLRHVAAGQMVTIVPTGAMLTTQQAADILNVSRPYLSKLLKTGEIPYVSVGSHRRVRFTELMDYRNRRDAGRNEALDAMARLGQAYDAA